MIRNATISKSKLTDAKRVTFEIIGVIAVFAILILFVCGRRLSNYDKSFLTTLTIPFDLIV
jgi:hypothetical protein